MYIKWQQDRSRTDLRLTPTLQRARQAADPKDLKAIKYPIDFSTPVHLYSYTCSKKSLRTLMFVQHQVGTFLRYIVVGKSELLLFRTDSRNYFTCKVNLCTRYIKAWFYENFGSDVKKNGLLNNTIRLLYGRRLSSPKEKMGKFL